MPARRCIASVRAADAIDAVVGHNIRIQRMARRMSQKELAERIGVSFQQLQKYEQGFNRVGASRLFRLADVLSVPIKELFRGAPGGREHPEGPSPLRFLAQPKAFRLVRAFDQIHDRAARDVIVTLVETVAREQP